MTKATIEWEGWDVYQDWNGFISDRKSHQQYTMILWPTTDCPILIWLN